MNDSIPTSYHTDTPQSVRDALETARANGYRVRIFYGDRETGRDWLEECDVIGKIGRSCGSVRVPILLRNARSDGGPQLLDHCIVRIVSADTRHESYRHPGYVVPEFTIMPSTVAGYAVEVWHAGECHARFKREKSAAHWVQFMRGERMSK